MPTSGAITAGVASGSSHVTPALRRLHGDDPEGGEQPRTVIGQDEQEFTLPPLTLGDFMGAAIAGMRRRDRSAAQRRAQQDAERQRAEEAERERLREEEDQRRQRDDEEQRLLAEEAERQRREAEEKLRREEAKRAEREAAEHAWAEVLRNLAAEILATLQAQVGASYWPHLTEEERTAAATTITAAVDRTLEQKEAAEHQITAHRKKKRQKALEGKALVDAVLGRITDESSATVGDQAERLRKIGQTRLNEAQERAREQALRLAPLGSAELSTLLGDNKPSGDRLTSMYKAALQGKLELVHNDTYRTLKEDGEKRGRRFGPFSREYSVRIYGTNPSNPRYFVWCGWVVHVHFVTSERPTEWVYLHLKSKPEKRVPINHTINAQRDKYLGPMVTACIEQAKDDKLGDLKK